MHVKMFRFFGPQVSDVLYN